MSRKGFSFKSLLQADQAAAYLEDLARSIRAGTVSLSHGPDQLVLSPKDTLALEIEAGEKKEKQKLSIELSWRTVLDATSAESGLVISAEAPPPAEEEDLDDDDDDDLDDDDDDTAV